MDTAQHFQRIFQHCKNLFALKHKDYGTSWRVMRPSSLTDQILIKVKRIRSIQEKGNQKVDESIENEFIGIINYCIMAIIQLNLPENEKLELEWASVSSLYDEQTRAILALLFNKNHDYDEAWRDMRVSSMTDIILMKLYRVKQIEDNQGDTLVSEGLVANYQDIVNYSVFCLVQMNFNANE